MSQYCIDISLDEDIWNLIDILELCAYHCGKASIENLGRIFDIRREHEDHDFEDKDVSLDTFMQNLYDEISYRIDNIGDAYPFTYSPCDTNLVFKEDAFLTSGSYIYLFCLLLSTKHINITITNHERNLFEYCTIVASSGTFHANACHFGFPRTNNSGFLTRLKEIFEDTIGDGEVRDNFPIGVNPNVKDGKIDVIAWPIEWRSGYPIYFVQAASGHNWESKSMKEFKDLTQLTNWFSRLPSSQINVAIAIPHDLYPRYNGTRRQTEQYYATLFGAILWRFSLPKAIDAGEQLYLSGKVIVEKLNELNEIKTWVISQRSSIGACA